MKSCSVSQQRQEEQLSPGIPKCHKQDNSLPPPTESHVQGRALPALGQPRHFHNPSTQAPVLVRRA